MTHDREQEILSRDAYEAGAKAYKDGCSCLENPFKDSGTEYYRRRLHWELGWLDAAVAAEEHRR